MTLFENSLFGLLVLKKYHKRAVHLCVTARWCQDRRWPKACRTESSSERSPARCFPFLCLHDIFLPQGTWGSRLTRPGSKTRRTNTEISNHPNRAGGGWGCWRLLRKSPDPQQASLTALKFTFHTSSWATGEPPSVMLRTKFAVWLKAMPDRIFGSSVCVWATICLLDASLQRNKREVCLS